jgi:ATP-binding cassette subfamily B protein
MNNRWAKQQTGAGNQRLRTDGQAGSSNHKGESAQNPKHALGRLLAYLKPYKARLIAVAVLVTVSSLLLAAGPALMGQIIDDYLTPASSTFGQVSGLARMVGLMAVIYVGAVVASAVQGRIMALVAQKAMSHLREDLFAHIQGCSITFFDRQPVGDLMSRLTNDMDAINQLFAQNLTQIVSSVVSVLSILVTMFLLNWPLALAVILTVPVMFALIGVLAKKSQPRFRAAQDSIGDLNGMMEETLSGEQVVIAFGQQQVALADFRAANRAATEAGIRAQFLSEIIPALVMVMNNLSLVVVIGLGSALAIMGLGGVTVGLITSFTSYARRFSQPAMQIANLSSTIQSAAASAERIFEIIDGEPAVEDMDGASALADVRGHVVFEDVDFGYVPGKPVLRNVSLEAQPGQMFALVGPTGAGKTTIINVLTRFYDIQGGRITIDGQDIRGLQQDSLRRHLGIVLQDNFLFADTVMENIRYGHLRATDEEVIAAAELANADQFIRRLPHGYQTVLAERGSNLSQGQRQLLAIARAILADPDILILDEATSNVDTRTEKHLQKALMQLMEGRTSFVIAHRLSTIRDADPVLVIKEGEIVERGTHEELLSDCGFYHTLYTSQFKGHPEIVLAA